jgi:hypothetical protein
MNTRETTSQRLEEWREAERASDAVRRTPAAVGEPDEEQDERLDEAAEAEQRARERYQLAQRSASGHSPTD